MMKPKRNSKKAASYLVVTKYALTMVLVISLSCPFIVHLEMLPNPIDVTEDIDSIHLNQGIKLTRSSNSDDEGGKGFNNKIISSMLKRTSGDGWEIVPTWKLGDIERPNDKDFKVRWGNFTYNDITVPMAVHSHFDFVSRSIMSKHHWSDCDSLTELWNDEKSYRDKDKVYVEIGANIGSCVMQMLLSTDANIIAFEPHPKNQFVLRSTLAKLDKSYQDRVVLVPVALGQATSKSTIYSAKENLGNSVIGQVIKDYDAQKFLKRDQFEIPIERLDSILNSHSANISLVKMDAQGFECNIMEGIGTEFADKIKSVKFEVAKKWLEAQNCFDLLERFRRFDFNVYSTKGKSFRKLFTEETNKVESALAEFIAIKDK
mmetsp:Transcript_14950/g.18232  ORF Transcript_14950/g.18232 Transcript_14950/m.18232 type:complete len:374 (+) Transcript_14950:90-1211(+)